MNRKPKGCLSVCGAIIVWNVAWMAVFSLTSIVSQNDDGSRTDLSGTYLFSDENVSGIAMGNAILGVRSTSNNSSVTIQHVEGKLNTTSVWDNGRMFNKRVDLSDQQFWWSDNQLNSYKQRRLVLGGILPGVGRSSKSSTINRDSDGNLHISYVVKEKALMLFVIPFWESHECKVTLIKTGENHNQKVDHIFKGSNTSL